MFKSIFNQENLISIANERKKRKFKAGYDGMSMEGASGWLYINSARLIRDIKSGDYSPMPAVGFKTAKTNGGYRNLVRITAIDTILQTAINNALIEECEKTFLNCSMAFRPERGVYTALKQYVDFANKYSFVVKIDISNCYDNIDHEILSDTLPHFVGDEHIRNLIMKFVKTPVYSDKEITKTEKGLLQGMPLSPTLSNVYMHSFDEFSEALSIPCIRYADDIVLFASTLTEAKSICDKASVFITEKLKLPFNERKVKIDSPISIAFLGHKFTRDKKGIIVYEANSNTSTAYYNWNSRIAENSRGRVDIISDGILRQKDFSLLFDTDTTDTHIPVAPTQTINIYSDVVFDTGFLSTALKNGISINVFSSKGENIGSFIPNTSLFSPRTTYDQLLSYYDEKKRMYLAKEFVLASIHNSLLNIRYHKKQEKDISFDEAINNLMESKKRINSTTNYEKLLLEEARARQIYYDCFDSFIKQEEFRFEQRSKRPPKNEVNALLSFGNTVLSNLISTEIQKSPLDVKIGYLHATTSKRKASLNLDVAEIFKPLLVDRVIFSLINKGTIRPKHFTTCENDGVYLTEDGKREFLQAFYQKLNATLDNKDVQMSYNSIIIEEIRKLVRHFKGTQKYKGFRQVR